ncbi:MAG: hypothetical protein JNL84_13085 [Candidatus Accumulibacter sp.]|nr:hypothetical protein [Accumulibacter sp.]
MLNLGLVFLPCKRAVWLPTPGGGLELGCVFLDIFAACLPGSGRWIEVTQGRIH